MSEENNIGYIVRGSLKEGFIARLNVSPDSVREGSFIVIQSGTYRYYGLATDLRLCATDPRFADELAENRLPAPLAKLLHNQTLYTELEILPALMQNIGPDLDDPTVGQYAGEIDPNPLPVKTLPLHHAPVKIADGFDVAAIFGNPEDKDKFAIGTTREQGHKVAIDMNKFVQRSSGIFGATGTGKSYLTRLILAGLIHSGKASVLVFDMHNEYAFGDRSSDTNITVPGLRDKLGYKVKVCAVGRGTLINGRQPDFDLSLNRQDIGIEDILMLSRELNLRETSANTLSALEHDFGSRDWFKKFMEMKSGTEEGSVTAWANEKGVNAMAAESLQGKLRRVYNRPYVTDNPSGNAVNGIISALSTGNSVVLSFGKYESDLDYLLIANILTRKIREAWEEMTNAARNNDKEPQPLVIAVEEAHKLLNREMASQTAFSIIAREMRKYYVTLLVIDQRPSQIYDEVMSQLGTRISGWLGDDADIAAVLSGLSGRDSLRGMLARLQPKQEVLLLGYGVPMPIPVSSRRYDETFWRELLGAKAPLPPAREDGSDWLSLS